MYDCIKTDPFEIHDGADDLTQVFFNPDHEGYLIKEGMSINISGYVISIVICEILNTGYTLTSRDSYYFDPKGIAQGINMYGSQL